MFELDLKSRTPIYHQLKENILQLVMLGGMEEGQPLPSVRSMARDLGINPNTVAKAYQDLEREGIIYSVQGKGSFISPISNFDTQYKDAAITKFSEAVLQAKNCGVEVERLHLEVDKIYGGVNL